MIPMFGGIDNIDTRDTRKAVVQLIAHIRNLESELRMVLENLGSENMGKLNLDDLRLYTEKGTEISGDKIKVVGPSGESFEAGFDKHTGEFVFQVPENVSLKVGSIQADSVEVGTVNAESVTASGAVVGETVEGTLQVYCAGDPIG